MERLTPVPHDTAPGLSEFQRLRFDLLSLMHRANFPVTAPDADKVLNRLFKTVTGLEWPNEVPGFVSVGNTPGGSGSS